MKQPTARFRKRNNGAVIGTHPPAARLDRWSNTEVVLLSLIFAIAFAMIVILLLSGCSIGPTRAQAVTTPPPSRTLIPPTPIPTITPAPIVVPKPTVPPYAADVFNIVVLGQDETAQRCQKGYHCGADSHSDVFVIVHIVMHDPVEVTAFLVPRNLWVPEADMIPGTFTHPIPDMWSMQVYGKLGFTGIHDYVYRVFGLPVQAVVVVKMDRFVELVDSLGGLQISEGLKSGADVLTYLRDNDNNWGCLVYDCAGRVFVVGQALADRLMKDPLWLIQIPGLWDSDTTIAGMFSYVPVAQKIAHGYTLRTVRVWTPEIIRGDTPLDVRGMVPTEPLYMWMALQLKESYPVSLNQQYGISGREVTAAGVVRRCLRYAVLIDRWNPDFHLDPNLVFAVMAKESACTMDAQDPAGYASVGLMQVIPRSWTASVGALQDPAINIFWGMKILHFAIEEGGSVVKGLQLYNCGQATLKDHPTCGLGYALEVIGFWEPRVAAERGG